MHKSALFAFGLVVAALVALGLVVLSSASEANGIRLHKDAYFFMKRQFAYLGGGLIIAVFTAWFDYRKWRENWGLVVFGYVLVFILLLAVFAFPKINGSYRWIALGPLRLQPSELAKLFVVIALSVWLDRSGWRVELFKRGALCSFLIIGVLALPILFETDFGSTVVLAFAGLLVMFLAGVRIWHTAPLILLGLAGIGVKLMMNRNRMARIMAFLGGGTTDAGAAETMDVAARNAAHQARMALVAIKNGGIWGVGLNESMQKQYYLPEAHTDFIFAIGAEELGLFFSIAVIFLFLAFFALAVYIASHASDRLGRYLVMGMTFIIFFQATFNIGVVCEALPTKGMALPFFSYGGTNLLSAFFAVGTILSVGIHAYQDRKRTLRPSVLMK